MMAWVLVKRREAHSLFKKKCKFFLAFRKQNFNVIKNKLFDD